MGKSEFASVATAIAGVAVAAVGIAFPPGSADARWSLLALGLLLVAAAIASWGYRHIWREDGRQQVLGEEIGSPSHRLEPQARDSLVFRTGPREWCTYNASNQPDIILRCIAALPSTVTVHSTGEFATRERGERRETVVLDTLRDSALTAWLRKQQTVWHWKDAPEWTINGATGNPELTIAQFVPAREQHVATPLVARCCVLTGWSNPDGGERRACIQVAVDILVSLLELDAERRPAAVRHATTPPPAPAALSPEELSEALHQAMIAPAIAAQLVTSLLPPGEYGHGLIGAWLSFTNGDIPRVVDLTRFRRLDQASSRPEAFKSADLPFDTRAGGTSDFVADVLYELLETSGFRGTEAFIDQVRRRQL